MRITDSELVPRYTAGELRAWHRGYRAYVMDRPYKCYSQDANYIAAWRAGWFSAMKREIKESEEARRLKALERAQKGKR